MKKIIIIGGFILLGLGVHEFISYVYGYHLFSKSVASLFQNATSDQNEEENRKKENSMEEIFLIEPKTTYDLEKIFENFNRDAVPRIYIASFPEDFEEKGTPDLFIKTLLPLILKENEKILKERQKLLRLVFKIRQGKILTQEEQKFFDYLITKYDIFEKGIFNQTKQLLLRVDRISPALAITQALEETNGGRDLTSIFGVYKWDDEGNFSYALYPNLEKAVSDYVHHLNTTIPYYVFWELRALNRTKRQPMKARVFMEGLSSYRYGDRFYVQKLIDVFNQYELINLDNAQLEKEGEINEKDG